VAEPVVVPKRPVRARVTLFGGKRVNGEFFTEAAARTHYGPETLLELLNNDTRTFVPFNAEGGTMLLNRESVRLVEFDSPELLDVFVRPDNEYIYAVKIVLRTETQELALQGFCYTGDLHPESRRPADLLNSRDKFLMFYSTGSLMLVNKDAVSHANVG
jgi:hypothetical protein